MRKQIEVILINASVPRTRMFDYYSREDIIGDTNTILTLIRNWGDEWCDDNTHPGEGDYKRHCDECWQTLKEIK